MNEPITLSDEFKGILDQLEYTSDHIFITGRAGTGKSTLLQVFRNTSQKRIVVLAPTGIAALNVRGQTLHSFFGFPPRMMDKSEIEKRKNFRLYQNIDLIIIDEISMVRADMLDNIDRFLRINRGVDRPFGGVQMVFFGDLFQLPPVVSTPFEKQYFQTTYTSPYFFAAHIIPKLDLKMLELNQVYRQDERFFINLLDNIRMNRCDFDDFVTMNERYCALPEDKSFFITLTSRNDIALRINEQELKEIESPPFTYQGSVMGSFDPRLFPTEYSLILKEGAQVMFVKNDVQKRYVNGTIGIIAECHEENIKVKIEDDYGNTQLIDLGKEKWEILKYDKDPSDPNKIITTVIGTFEQYPIKLAWAITIHKSQGKTFEKVIIDLGYGAFESGQTYVALSRCKTFEGIILKQPLKTKDIILDERINEYYEQIKYLS